MIRLLILAFVWLGYNDGIDDGIKDKIKYPVSEIPKSLIKDAKSVIREYSMEFTVHDLGLATKKVHKALTILNKSAKSQATEYIFYDKFSKVSGIRGTIYDASGKVVKKLKGSDIHDISAISGFSVYEDNRAKVLDFSIPSYPFTVAYEYEVSISGLLFYPTWRAQPNSKTSIQHSSYTVKIPFGNDLRYKERNLPDSVIRSFDKLTGSYSWRVNNITAFKREPYGPPYEKLLPHVATAPGSFEMGGYRGSLVTWDDMGDWINVLNKGRENLPISTIQEVEGLLEGITEKRQKTKIIYEYMQDKTRYVSIQLGIGGFQPFSASSVDEDGYGDCKALSNYTMALLSAMGIDANYTLVLAGAGESNIDTSFPSSQFNHVILAVPLDKDTVWLECTSQTNPFGYMGSFTGDRNALMITPEGGKIVHTPVYPSEVNTQLRFADVVIDETGTGFATVSTEYHGIQYENVNRQMARSAVDQKKWLYNHLDLPNVVIESFGYKEQRNEIPTIAEDLKLTIDHYASSSGKRYFFKPNMLNTRHDWPKKLKERKTEVFWNLGYVDTDSIHFSLPESFHIEFIPESIQIDSEFGSYSAAYFSNEKGITYVRKMTMKKGRYPASSYDSFTEFLKSVVKNDNAKIVVLGAT